MLSITLPSVPGLLQNSQASDSSVDLNYIVSTMRGLAVSDSLRFRIFKKTKTHGAMFCYQVLLTTNLSFNSRKPKGTVLGALHTEGKPSPAALRPFRFGGEAESKAVC